MLFDTHCHLNDEQFAPDLAEVIERARDRGVTRVVVPGVDIESSVAAVTIAQTHDGVFAAVGVHPESLGRLPDVNAALDRIAELAQHRKVVAIGEIGLDYYWDTAPRDVQRDVLRRQLRMARALGLPAIIHNRDATEDTVHILETEQGPDLTGVMHCFTGSYETAERCMAAGFYISFGGPLTFRNARHIPEVAARIPADRLLIETDAPYLTPHPHRGKRNEPGHVLLVAEKLAEIRQQTVEDLIRLTADNGLRLFSGAM